MGITAFVAQARDHYVNQFAAFADKQKRGCTCGASELKLQLSEACAIFQNLYCVDFIKKDERIEIMELQPDRILKFDVISGSFGAAALSIEHLRWDDVVIYHDVPVLPEEKIPNGSGSGSILTTNGMIGRRRFPASFIHYTSAP